MASRQEQLAAYGYTVGTTFYASITLSLVVAGIQCFMCFYSLSAFLETPPDLRKGRAPYIAVSFILFVLNAVSSALDAYYIFSGLTQSSGWLELFKVLSQAETSWARITSLSLNIVWIALGDGLLLYRCYIIWYEQRWVTILPGLVYLTTIGMTVASTVQAARAELHDGSADISTSLLTTFTNITITALILFRLISARRYLGKALSSQVLRPYKDASTIVIESAAPLAFFGVLYAAVTLAGHRSQSIDTKRVLNGVNAIMGFFFYAALALSPQMIIFKIATGKTWMRQSEASRDVLSRSLAFVHNDRGDQGTSETSMEGTDSHHL